MLGRAERMLAAIAEPSGPETAVALGTDRWTRTGTDRHQVNGFANPRRPAGFQTVVKAQLTSTIPASGPTAASSCQA